MDDLPCVLDVLSKDDLLVELSRARELTRRMREERDALRYETQELEHRCKELVDREIASESQVAERNAENLALRWRVEELEGEAAARLVNEERLGEELAYLNEELGAVREHANWDMAELRAQAGKQTAEDLAHRVEGARVVAELRAALFTEEREVVRLREAEQRAHSLKCAAERDLVSVRAALVCQELTAIGFERQAHEREKQIEQLKHKMRKAAEMILALQQRGRMTVEERNEEDLGLPPLSEPPRPTSA